MPLIDAPDRVPIVCVAENRLSCEPGIRLLIASLARSNPDIRVELFFPEAPAAFINWLSSFPQVGLNNYRISGTWLAYNIKAQAILRLMEAGFKDVLWIDSDVLICRDVTSIYRDISPNSLIVTEEAMCSSHYDGNAVRARSWGLPIGRKLPFALNSGVIGVSTEHIPLLEKWRAALESPMFVEAFHRRWDKRPIHFMGDQEALTALLCSSEFASIPLRILKRGSEIIQFFGPAGYTVGERIRHMINGPPIFIHSQGHKVWLPYPDGTSTRDKLMRYYQASSPYLIAARRYRDVLSDVRWLGSKSLRSSTKGPNSLEIPLAGMLTAAILDVARYVRWPHTGGEPRRPY